MKEKCVPHVSSKSPSDYQRYVEHSGAQQVMNCVRFCFQLRVSHTEPASGNAELKWIPSKTNLVPCTQGRVNG